MPELTEEMYCSQQICIPPTFLYLLRQFAKAAIRTQPSDLLKWSTTYFRCLSLNLPAPVKPRLEYPIPKDHLGLTPGWLRALLYQFQGNQTVSFKVLWDRWIGACLDHDHLIQILCLGGFTDNTAVPWLRFVALCAGHITENLTQTMILICEILTEEPEGGSAMISVDVFLDLYQFLAQIDASQPQVLKNVHFLDDFLGLFKERVEKEIKVAESEEDLGTKSDSTVSSDHGQKSEEELIKIDETGSAVSCPSVDEATTIDYLKMVTEGQEEGEEEGSVATLDTITIDVNELPAEATLEPAPQEEQENSGEEPEEPQEKNEQEDERETKEIEEKTKMSGDVETVANVEDAILAEDLERLRTVQMEEMAGENDDDEVEKFKACLVAEMGMMTTSQEAAVGHYTRKTKTVEELENEKKVEKIGSDDTKLVSEKEKVEEVEVKFEDVYVDAIPGIGGVIPQKLVQAVCKYMMGTAKEQHQMVMPRNVKHYECPPLEVVNY